MIEIRKIAPGDHDRVWEILQAIISQGDVLAYVSSREEMLAYWCDECKHTYVAIMGGEVAGTFFIQDNQPGRGSHIANAAYAVDPSTAGKGIGRYMAEYSLTEAKRLGYRAMQFNLVVKSNKNAVKLWQKMGFEIIGEIPQAFDHIRDGLVGAYIMYRVL